MISHLLFGGVVWACLMPIDFTLDTYNSAFYKAELFLRKMLRWATSLPLSTRNSFLYFLTNLPTV